MKRVNLLACVIAAQSVWAGQPAPVPSPPERPIVIRTTTSGGSFLGVGVVEIDPERAKALNLREEHGVEITRLDDDGPASKAGLKVGDVVLEYNGQRVEGLQQFIRLVHETPAGREVKLTVNRGGSTQTVALRTGARKGALGRGDGTIELPRLEIPEVRIAEIPRAYMSWRSTVLGIEAEALDSQLANYFGVKEGVLVRSVSKGSAAEKAGLKAGDVILRVDDQKVTSPREVSTIVRNARGKKTLSIVMSRDRRETTVTLQMEDEAEFQRKTNRLGTR